MNEPYYGRRLLAEPRLTCTIG